MEEKLPIRPAIKVMEIGEKLTYPITRMNAVRKTATEISIITSRKFSVNQSNNNTTITVTRIS